MKTAILALLFGLSCRAVFAAETNLTLTVDGITYSNVTFGTVTPAAASIFYHGGIMSVPLSKLPPDLQKRFGYDPQKSSQHQTYEIQAVERARLAEAERTRKLNEKRQQETEASNHAKQLANRAVVVVGDVIQVMKDGAVIRTGDVYAASYFNQARPGARAVSSSELVYDREIFLVNHPKQKSLADGDKVRCFAAQDGLIKFGAETLQKWVWIAND